MKKWMLFFLVVATVGFSDSFVLENQTSYPDKSQKSKIAIQWASSANEVNEANNALMNGLKLNSKTLQTLKQTGTLNLNIPKKVEYFRIVAWSTGTGEPDFVTNWIDVVPGKTYTLQTDHLVPTVLMQGTGC
jgi:hypothetical protein